MDAFPAYTTVTHSVLVRVIELLASRGLLTNEDIADLNRVAREATDAANNEADGSDIDSVSEFPRTA